MDEFCQVITTVGERPAADALARGAVDRRPVSYTHLTLPTILRV